jgi:hypothetical protein
MSARLSYNVVKRLPRAAVWPIAIAAAVRFAAWAMIPAARFASDEQGYVDAGIALATTGRQDLFWPPLTGWIVAAIKVIAPAASLAALRLLWIVIDLVNLALIATLAERIARVCLPGREARFVVAATLAYALYLPAISHAQFVTSEMPALLLVLAPAVILSAPTVGLISRVSAGVLLGALVLVRANLLPLLVLMPAAALSNLPAAAWLRRTAIVAVIGAIVVGAAIARNWVVYDEPTLSRNAAYNLYIGNRDVYAEDLNLFHPRATPEQIEFRRQFFAGTLSYPSGTSAELQRDALQWIAGHPGQFARRALGRLARVFAPKTDVLELVGGEAAAGIWSPRALGLLAVANLEWLIVLFAGLWGLCVLIDRDRRIGVMFVSIIAGSVLLCLIAISKPRYSFVFDPLLIIAATLMFMSAGPDRIRAWRRYRPVLIASWAFLAWGWIAWTIFALSSRLG